MRKLVLAALAATMLSGAANAALVGTSVSLTAYYPDSSTVFSSGGSAVVGSGVEFGTGALDGYPLSFDFTDTALTVAYPSGSATSFAAASFNGFKITFSSSVPTSFTVDPTSTLLLTSSSLVGNVLSLNYSGQAVAANSATRISFGFGSTPGVPEPATWAMMIAGFGLVGGAMRRRKVNVSFA